MAPGIGVITLVLVAAALHATWNALVKAGGDRLSVMAVTMGLPALPFAVALLFVPIPAAASWPFLIASVVFHWGYYVCLLYAYRHGDLSQVYPIARGSAPLLVAFGAWLLASERLNIYQSLGVLILSAGIASLAWRQEDTRRAGEGRAIAFALMTGAMIGLYSLADGLGVRRAATTAGYILWMFVLTDLPFLFFALWRRRGQLRTSLLPNLKPGIGGAVSMSLAYAIVIWAMSVAPLVHVVALRETSVVMAALIGALALKESFGLRRIVAAVVVACGVAILQVG